MDHMSWSCNQWYTNQILNVCRLVSFMGQLSSLQLLRAGPIKGEGCDVYSCMCRHSIMEKVDSLSLPAMGTLSHSLRNITSHLFRPRGWYFLAVQKFRSHIWGQQVYGIPLYLPPSFVVNLKLFWGKKQWSFSYDLKTKQNTTTKLGRCGTHL